MKGSSGASSGASNNNMMGGMLPMMMLMGGGNGISDMFNGMFDFDMSDDDTMDFDNTDGSEDK